MPYSYLAAPTVSDLSTHPGPATGGNTVTVVGSNLTLANVVSFGGSPATGINVAPDNQLTVTAPPGAGTVVVTVTTPGGTSTAATGNPYYTYLAAPVLTSLTPLTAPISAARGAYWAAATSLAPMRGPSAASRPPSRRPPTLRSSRPPRTAHPDGERRGADPGREQQHPAVRLRPVLSRQLMWQQLMRRSIHKSEGERHGSGSGNRQHRATRGERRFRHPRQHRLHQGRGRS
ncbi:IPT/TIG domain-containing protein [Streptomyces kronopolitis]|uniref:IPT/TIG domain-containing protein n=1 Tax=Streptomyces kronopolitis TaxID=1612435 RepID=UPI003692AED0